MSRAEPWPRWLVVLLTVAMMLLAFALVAAWGLLYGPGAFGGIEPLR